MGASNLWKYFRRSVDLLENSKILSVLSKLDGAFGAVSRIWLIISALFAAFTGIIGWIGAQHFFQERQERVQAECESLTSDAAYRQCMRDTHSSKR
jgi:hypothetical protein